RTIFGKELKLWRRVNFGKREGFNAIAKFYANEIAIPTSWDQKKLIVWVLASLNLVSLRQLKTIL
ncbi:hypothetical protein JZU68_01610, partial [bacterium]|nr:hypothetical protein [bacterium]